MLWNLRFKYFRQVDLDAHFRYPHSLHFVMAAAPGQCDLMKLGMAGVDLIGVFDQQNHNIGETPPLYWLYINFIWTGFSPIITIHKEASKYSGLLFKSEYEGLHFLGDLGYLPPSYMPWQHLLAGENHLANSALNMLILSPGKQNKSLNAQKWKWVKAEQNHLSARSNYKGKSETAEWLLRFSPSPTGGA